MPVDAWRTACRAHKLQGREVSTVHCPAILGRANRDSFQRIVDWLDLNAVCYGDYSWNKLEWRTPLLDGEHALREHLRARFGAAFASAPFAALVNVALPEESRALKAPLAASAGGWGQISEHGWRDTTDADYVATRRLVDAAIAPLLAHDIAGTCGHDDKCLCECCWVRRAASDVRASAE